MSILKRYLLSRSGNFGIITALLIFPLIGSAGMVIDYSNASEIRSRLMGVADAAALGAISETSSGYAAAVAMPADGRVVPAEETARKLFLSNANNFMALTSDNVSVSVLKSGDDVKSAVTFSVSVPTYFMHVVGFETITVAGTGTATFAAGGTGFADYHLLLDNTPSMGLGATKRDIDALVAATPTKCAFACHEVWNSGVENENSNYLVARREGITLRIDVLKQAVVSLVDEARKLQGSNNHFRFAAYTFGKAALEPGYQIGKLAGLTADLVSFRKSVGNVELMTTPHSNYNQDALTSFDTALTEVGNEIKSDGGTGKTTSDREQVVLFVTDGVGNSIKPKNCTGFYSGSQGRCFEPIDLKFCQALKARGIKIAVLYTTYVPVDDHLYNTYIKKFADQIAPKLKQCASPDLFSEVGIEGDMKAAMAKLFGKAASAMRLRLAS